MVVVAILLSSITGALGLLGGFQIGWTAREHQIERRILRNALPPARVAK